MTSIAKLLVVATFLLPGPAISSSSGLDGMRTLRCEFEDGVFTVWGANGRTTKKTGKMSPLVFDSIKPARTGSGRLIGNVGSSDVTYLRTVAGMTITEITGVGGVNTTTIFSAYSRNRGFKSVHSRHLDAMDELMLSQYYGTCRSF